MHSKGLRKINLERKSGHKINLERKSFVLSEASLRFIQSGNAIFEENEDNGHYDKLLFEKI